MQTGRLHQNKKKIGHEDKTNEATIEWHRFKCENENSENIYFPNRYVWM